ncbi:MAG: leucine-rich repeat domain-containing protein [Oligoflexia bacterium]|nr:leucine-rich repeat domain-containing protein [Oligoflexia bacterium]
MFRKFVTLIWFEFCGFCKLFPNDERSSESVISILVRCICFLIISFSLFSCSGINVRSGDSKVEKGKEGEYRGNSDDEEGECIGSYNICDRTREVREAIMKQVIKEAGQRDCDEVTKRDLENITELSIKKKGIVQLKSGDFFGLTSVKKLWLGMNSLEELPECLFFGLDSVELIDLCHNNLSYIETDMLSEVGTLQIVYLEGNPFSEKEKARIKRNLEGELETVRLKDPVLPPPAEEPLPDYDKILEDLEKDLS